MKTLFTDRIRARQNAGFTVVIPDIKCRSPRDGDLLRGRDPAATARLLVDAGAPVLSVVTESEHFGGSMMLLDQVIQETRVPVLRKDFITTRDELIRTRDAGASAILLISARVLPKELAALFEFALEIGIEPLVETHTAAELRFAAGLGARLIGINNRNIIQLEKDNGTVAATTRLAADKPAGSLLISESAIETTADVRCAVEAGADAVLVGTSLWQAPDMLLCFRQLSRPTP